MRHSLSRRLTLATGAIVCALSMSGCHEIFCGDAQQGYDWVFKLVGGVHRCERVAEAKQPYAFFSTDPNPAFRGDRIDLDGSGSAPSAGTVESYRWDLDGDNRFDEATGPRASVTFPDAGEYTVSLLIRDSQGKRGRADQTIEVFDRAESPPPVAIIDASATTINPGTTVTFKGDRSYDPNGSISGYDWDLDGDGYYESSSPAPVEHTYTQPGTFTARLRVTDSDGLTAIAEQPIEVSNVMAARFTISENPARLGHEVTFDASGSTGDILRFQWDLDGDPGYEVTEFDPITTKTYGERYSGGETVRVELKVSNANGDIFSTASEMLGFTSATSPGPGLFKARPRAAAGLPFKANLVGQTYGRHAGRLRVSRRAASIVGRAMIGRLRGSLGRDARGDPLGDLLPAMWIGRVSTTASRGKRRVSVRGIAYAAFERAPGGACLKFRLRSRGGRRTGTLVTAGGNGDGAQVAAKARFRWKLGRRGGVRLRGTIARRGTPRDPGPACLALLRLRP